MRKSILGIMAIMVSVIATGCSQSDTNFTKKTVSINGEYFGETMNKGYETGSKLYNPKGELVGFIDTDDLVYKNNVDNELCGGTVVGICQPTGDNTCNVPNFEEVTYFEDGGSIIPPYSTNSCGERL